MILVLLGAPGVGKGTQASLLSQKYNIPILSTGEILRTFTSTDNGPLAKQVKSIISSGNLVNDEIVATIVKQRIIQDDCVNGFILDGFPRTIIQAEELTKIIKDFLPNKKVYIINIEVKAKELINRLSSRFLCKNCKKVYNHIYSPTKIDGKCDICDGIEFIQRTDDKKEVVEQRMNIYKEQTQPLIEYYTNRNNLINVNGMQDIAKVFLNITESI